MEEKRSLLREIFGFYKNPAYVEENLREADMRSVMYLSFIVSCIEIGMLIRYVFKYVLTGRCETVWVFLHYTKGYWILLISCVLICLYAYLYTKGRAGILKPFNRVFIFLFFSQSMYFGIVTSMSDLHKGRMIICFMTMIMYVTVIFIIRPFVSLFLTVFYAAFFVYVVNHFATNPDDTPYQMEEGDFINYVTFFVSLTVLEFTVYYQRYRDATASYRLHLAAITDELTGIPNMNSFSEDSKERLSNSLKEGKSCVFLVFDIGNFKTYNDRVGYSGGNELLRRMASVMRDNFSDMLYARLSDDKFVAFYDGDDYKKRAERVREDFLAMYSTETYMDVKVGAYFAVSDSIEPRHALDSARYALSTIKNHEDIHIAEYDEKLSKEYKIRQYILNNIDTAIKEGYIKVFYQPVIWSKDDTLAGTEALARWIDPKYGFLSPGQFIPVLEESRQIHKLDRCIYELVCKNMRQRMDAGEPVLATSINFSRLDFELMDAVGELEAMVQKYDIDRDLLHVEITESALSDDMELLHRAMDDLHSRGYVIWLDDFGSGYSSMNVLKDFKFDLLKIDMEFLKNFSGNEKSRIIIRTIVELANELGMKTLTEGVETEEAVEFLRDIGCGRLQGFYYGKPMEYDELLEEIKNGRLSL